MVRSNKRGNVFDTLFFTITFFVAGILAIVSVFVLSNYSSEINSIPDAPQDAKDAIADYREKTPKALDSGMLLAFIAMHLGIVFLGLLLRSHPIVYPFFFLVLVVIVALGAYMSNAYDEFASEAEFSSYADEFPKVSWLLDNYVMVTLIFGFIDILAFLMISSFLGGDI